MFEIIEQIYFASSDKTAPVRRCDMPFQQSCYKVGYGNRVATSCSSKTGTSCL